MRGTTCGSTASPCLTRDEALAEDVVSEVFLHAWRGARTSSEVKVSTAAGDRPQQAKDAQRRRHEYLSDDDAPPSRIPRTTRSHWSKKERGALLQECLTKLPAAQRGVIDLVYYHHKSVEGSRKSSGFRPPP
jgi:DNA-directed RNA polymerase specialized sigma24 family protein